MSSPLSLPGAAAGGVLFVNQVATEYFRSGADKVSIGSDAVQAAQDYIASGVKTGSSSIETIARAYGSQVLHRQEHYLILFVFLLHNISPLFVLLVIDCWM